MACFCNSYQKAEPRSGEIFQLHGSVRIYFKPQKPLTVLIAPFQMFISLRSACLPIEKIYMLEEGVRFLKKYKERKTLLQ